MKISTSWSQADWDKALKKVWELSRNFEEILNFGLEHNFITSSDIIHASDIYKDPYKTYEDCEVEDVVANYPLSDLMKIIQNKYSLDDIIDELDKDEIMDSIGDDELFSHIENSYVMDVHDDEMKEQIYKECMDELTDDFEYSQKNEIKRLQDSNSDDLHKHICEIINCGYYDQESIDKFKDKLNKNGFGIKY